jgi:tetratricopeptide (TPR) repeat protein
VEALGTKKNIFKVSLSILVLVLVSNLYFFVQYEAERKYQEFIILSSDESKYKEIFGEDLSLDKSISLLESSAKLFSNADYSIYLSKAYLSKAISYNSQYESDTDNEKKLSFVFAEKAEDAAKLATTINPKNFFVWENLGMIYEDIEKIDSSKAGEAIIAYKKAETLAPFNYEIYVLYGRKLEKDGDKAGALNMYKKALELKPDFAKLEEVINALEN